MDKVIKQATLDSVLRKKDRSLKLSFVTDLEQSSEEFMELDEMLNTHGILYFRSVGDLTHEEVEILDEVDIELEGKTKSQRLRNVLFVYCEQTKQGDFKEFYSNEMERIIEHYKSKLDES